MHAPPVPADDETHLEEDRLVADPLSDELERLWHGTARTNTAIFTEIFRTVPNDSVRNWDQYKVGRLDYDCLPSYFEGVT